MEVCLFGCGRMGRIHAENLAAHPDARLKYIVDVNPETADLARRLGARAVDAETALADGSLDAVVIASSTDTHLPLIEAAAAARLAVFCEKPLDLDAGRARGALRAARDAGIRLNIGFNRRYDPGFRRLKDEIAAGAVGRVEVVSITSRDPAPPSIEYIRRSGGLLRDMTIHDLDMARWLLGEEPVSVYASGSCLVDPAIGDAGDIDSAVLVLRTASGSLAQITNSRRCRFGYDQRVEVFGADGLLRADNETATSVVRAGTDGFLSEPALPFFLERYREAYRLEIADFLRALSGQPIGPLADGEDGVRVLELADAAEASRRTDRVVSIAAP
ncbi:MAG TPA: inositol 2-dehydrogenase [Woeseiaceae bacterium]|nr:inositol 2-dehydrogenase [Woeseiaceae bacterium]